MELKEVLIKSTIDGTMQPSLIAKCDLEGKRPLLVDLHTWSADRFNHKSRLAYAECHGFHLVLPEFRGPNLISNPHCTEACGSVLAMQDIKDAIDYMIANAKVDTDNIFIVGCSGGGHMALMMAGYCPTLFKAVAAFVPVTDLVRWKDENEHYGKHVIACTGGDIEEMKKRSPVSYIDEIAKANVKIFAGKYDHLVPFRHTLDFYNLMLEKHPEARIYIDIYDAGHQYDGALFEHWLNSQYKEAELGEVTG